VQDPVAHGSQAAASLRRRGEHDRWHGSVMRRQEQAERQDGHREVQWPLLTMTLRRLVRETLHFRLTGLNVLRGTRAWTAGVHLPQVAGATQSGLAASPEHLRQRSMAPRRPGPRPRYAGPSQTPHGGTSMSTPAPVMPA